MKKSMIESSKSNTHSLKDYAYSKEVVRDFPKVLSVYNKLLPVLYQYAQYTGVWEVIMAVEDCQSMMKIQHDFYKKIYENKGKIKDE
jgi:hypothetical protein